MSDGGGSSGRYDAGYLEKVRPKLVRFCIGMSALLVVTLAWVTWDLAHRTPTPGWAIPVLAVVMGTTLAGAFLIGRKRRRSIVAGTHARDMARAPDWLGPLLAIVPGVAIIGSQAIGRSNPLASDVLGLVIAYVACWFVGLTLGLVGPAASDPPRP